MGHKVAIMGREEKRYNLFQTGLLSHYLPRETEENHKKSLLGWSKFGPRINFSQTQAEILPTKPALSVKF
jgi:hypothetical protein